MCTVFRGISEHQLSTLGNNFNVIRITLAAFVIYTHSYWRVTGISNYDNFSHIVGVPIAYLAVNGFFFVSGFLICMSLLRQKHISHFYSMRIVRIWPGLIFCTLITILLFSSLSFSFSKYFSNIYTIKFFLASVTQTFSWYYLPIVSDKEYYVFVNGSLWTIAWELRCYIALSLFYIIPNRYRIIMMKYLISVFLILCLIWIMHQRYAEYAYDSTRGVFYIVGIMVRLFGSFAMGSFCSLFVRHIRVSLLLSVILWGVAVLEFRLLAMSGMASVATYYTILTVAFWQQGERAFSAYWPDFSYGVYIYAFPVMTMIYTLFPVHSIGVLVVLCFVVTLMFAAFSWFVIERPSLFYARQYLKTMRKADAVGVA